MSQITTTWTSKDGSKPALIIDSYMVKPGEMAYFRKPAVSILNLGVREAGLFLRADGTIVADVPITRSPMTKTDADWIAKSVLTTAYVKSCGGPSLIRKCRCQYGVCGHCGSGEHDKCTTRVGFDGNPNPAPLTHLIGRTGSAYTAVWPAVGPSCRWYCPCTTCAAKPAETKPERKTAYRQARGDLVPGDTVWLTPRTLSAPAVCWGQPRATFLRHDMPYVFVKVNGIEHRVHMDNMRRSDPTEPSKPRAPRKQPKHAELPDGYEAGTLF